MHLMVQTYSHNLLRFITKIKKILRQVMSVGKKERQRFLYLGNPPDADHPLYFLWSIEPENINSWILDGETMLHIWDRLLSTQPSTILELGSGLSTLMFAKYAETFSRKSGGKIEIISLEHDEDWFTHVRDLLIMHNLSNWVEIVLSPIHAISVDGFTGESYDISGFPADNLDFVLIDGPPYNIGRKLTLPSLITSLSKPATIIIDDAQRFTEKEAIYTWCKNYPSTIIFKGFTSVGNGIGVLERV